MSTSAPSFLVVDDEPSIRFVLNRAFSQEGYRVVEAGSVAEAREAIESHAFDVVFLDVRLPDESGLDFLPELVERDDAPHVVVMTARESMEIPVEAMKSGARDFVVKPFEIERVLELARDLARRPKTPLDRGAPIPSGSGGPGHLVGASPAMVEVFKAIGRIAPTDETVLVVGESGTGKELVARAIHDNSARSGGPFVTVNCTAIPRDLMESELFGHERGSFTGAVERRTGKFEQAGSGTLFLDEIGELPMPLQSKLLRVLQERVVERVGGQGLIAVDVRIVAATHRDLPRMVQEQTFREDLYYRLAVVPLALPPLRERPGDVRRLANVFVAQWAASLTGHPAHLAPEAVLLLAAYPWPGNVRELENVIKRALLFSRGGELRADDLRSVMQPGVSPPLPPERANGENEGLLPSLASVPLEELVEVRLRTYLDGLGDESPDSLHAMVMGRVERALLKLVLERCGGNQLEAARVLGMNRNTLRKRIKDLEVPVPKKRTNRRHP